MAISHPKQARFHMMAKPASYRCNLKCDYCFYLEKEQMMQQPAEKKPQSVATAEQMSDAVLKRYVRDYIGSQDTDEIDFAWQGGEPTLAGLDFYRNVVKYQQQYADGKTITNSFQTNAVAINRQWAQFFADNNFLIGVSVDGAPEVHDKYRISVNGKPTFERVKHAISLLKEFNVQFNTLTVINDQNWNKGKETYHTLKALGSEHLQFIPIVEVEQHCQQNNSGHYSPTADATLTHFSVPAHGYGQFMAAIFDEWIKEDVGRIFVRMFDSMLATWMGYPASVCVQAKECGQAMVIEANGDLYSCDHYVYPANRSVILPSLISENSRPASSNSALAAPNRPSLPASVSSANSGRCAMAAVPSTVSPDCRGKAQTKLPVCFLSTDLQAYRSGNAPHGAGNTARGEWQPV